MYVKRDLEIKLKKYLSQREILAVIGPRQAGKSTLVNNFLDKLDNKKIKKVDFEDISVLQLFEEDIDNFIKEYVNGYDILFIDEIQYSQQSGKKLKYIYDTQNIKIIISGSSAVEISLQSLKYLVGRIFIFELQTFSFGEFLRYKNEKLYNIYLSKQYKETILSQINKYIEEYMTFGGYPKVVLEKDREIKINTLKNIYNTYLLREIKDILGFKDNFQLNNLIKVLSLQIGNIVNYNDLSAQTGITMSEIKNILNVLKQTYVSNLVMPFFKNKQKELVKSPKVFFFDLGFRNVAIDEFYLEKSQNIGSVYENFIYAEFLRLGVEPKFWRTKTKAEVDFIIEKGDNVIPIEIKTTLNNDVIGKGYISFLREYNPMKSYILSKNFEAIRKFEDKKIEFLPYARFLIDIIDEIRL